MASLATILRRNSLEEAYAKASENTSGKSSAEDSTSCGAAMPYRRKVSLKAITKNLPPAPCLRMKIISMGECRVGKSCLIKRYSEERFVDVYTVTIGVDFGVKRVVIDNKEVKVNFWDLSGNPEFLEIRNEFYKDAQGAILVYDVNQRKSFDALPTWLSEATRFGAEPSMVVYVCANKVDESPSRRVVSEQEGSRWASQRGFQYFEASAKSGIGVVGMFERLFQDVLHNVMHITK